MSDGEQIIRDHTSYGKLSGGMLRRYITQFLQSKPDKYPED